MKARVKDIPVGTESFLCVFDDYCAKLIGRTIEITKQPEIDVYGLRVYDIEFEGKLLGFHESWLEFEEE